MFINQTTQRINVHKTSASHASSVRRMMDKLTVYTHVDRFLIESRGVAACRVDGDAETEPATSSKCRRLVCESPL